MHFIVCLGILAGRVWFAFGAGPVRTLVGIVLAILVAVSSNAAHAGPNLKPRPAVAVLGAKDMLLREVVLGMPVWKPRPWPKPGDKRTRYAAEPRSPQDAWVACALAVPRGEDGMLRTAAILAKCRKDPQ